jgi:hypothetical protein
VRRTEESSGSEVDSGDQLARPNHLVRGYCRGPFVGSMVGTMVWDGLVALTREVKRRGCPRRLRALWACCVCQCFSTLARIAFLWDWIHIRSGNCRLNHVISAQSESVCGESRSTMPGRIYYLQKIIVQWTMKELFEKYEEASPQVHPHPPQPPRSRAEVFCVGLCSIFAFG